MRIPNIPRPLLRSVISIYRETKGEQDDVGEWRPVMTTVLSNLRANIQPDNSRLEWDLNGKQHIQSHVCYFDKYEAGDMRQPLAGDFLVDHTTGHRHRVLGLLSTYGENESGYYELALKFVGQDSRFSTVRRGTLRTKARIKTDSGTQRNFDMKAKIIDGS